MYFGPWIMDEFDTKIKTTCGDEIYLNRTYTGIGGTVSKENYTECSFGGSIGSSSIGSSDSTGSNSSDDSNDNEINYGTGIRAKSNYLQEPYDLSLGIDNKLLKSIYKPVAFGTGIGDRKVLTNPQYKWNGYKNSQKTTPKWYNGNYVNVPNLVDTEGYWNEDSSLGGTSMSYWDAHQKVLNDNPPKNPDAKQYINPQNDDSSNSSNTRHLNNSISGLTEGFSDGMNSECGCRPFKWNWIILLLVLLFVIMIVIAIR
jgi:hypothetical protein